MKANRTACIALGALLLPLAGCASIFHQSARVQEPGMWVPKERNAQEYAASQLALGKDALDQKQYGLALIAFRNAQRFPEVAAEAHNGLGIAFAQIGRPDLAERFFKLAISEAPAETRFFANLARFYDTTAAKEVRTVRAADPVPAPQLAMADGAALLRTSPTEVSLRLPGSAAPAPVMRRQAAAVQTAVIAPTRDAAGRRRNPGYPVKIELGAAAQMVRASATEVRIALPPSAADAPARRDPRRRAAPAPAGYPVKVSLR